MAELQQPQDSQHPEPLQEIQDRSLLLYHQQLLKEFDVLDPKQTVELAQHLGAPVVQAYFKQLANNALKDALRLKFEKPDEQLKLASRYGRLQGALEVCDLVTSTRWGK